ncbi:PorP/SprF family type IX secretion system membrane protein [Hymenobacter sp. BT507]|uniref:PorP/SprF family type IX secretion system membrane protein n=1 Tax=Hymenobacter citatus TaxID=2763506 RepID=A0ABR7MJB2_9BACT|nr:PorP/SprF family type IX secretion system membrane protein [Hymenobacter citatus]MBC6611179.1 PorP/SprF family type IX secretion system membrane protein [Hymenobacter citatus]
MATTSTQGKERWALRLAAAVVAVVASMTTTQAQDMYFAQPYASRLHTNPAYTGLLDDYSVTLNYRNQFPTLAGTFQTSQLGADYRFADQRSAVGLLLNVDRTGALGLTKFQVGGLYAYHMRLNEQVALSAGASVSYGRQTVSYGNLLLGDQISDDGTILGGPSTDPLLLQYNPVNYFTLGTGMVLYTERAWVGVAAHHLNQPDLGFVEQSILPIRLNFNAGYKYFFAKSVIKGEAREISLTPTVSYTRQGSLQRTEAGFYFTTTPVTVGAVYRGVPLPGSNHPQQLLTGIVGLSFGAFRLGYSYDASLSALSADLGGAHEVSLALRNFDRLEAAWRRLKRRNYPVAPCPAY